MMAEIFPARGKMSLSWDNITNAVFKELVEMHTYVMLWVLEITVL